MTVCIAVIANATTDDQKIIICNDTLTSGDLGSADFYQKDRFLSQGWHCLTAGEAGEVTALLPLLRTRFGANKTIDETNICTLVREAIADRKRQKADEFLISRWAMTFAQFTKAKDQFPQAIYDRAIGDIARIPLASDLLIVGFLDDGLPIIVSALGPTVEVVEHFGAAGQGAHLANASLLHREHNGAEPLELALYHAYEAKRHAQRVRSVGDHTHIVVISHKTEPAFITDDALEFLEAQFETYGPQNVPRAFSMPVGYLLPVSEIP